MLEYAPLKRGKVLDIGVGRGQISNAMLDWPDVTSCVGIGLEVGSYGILQSAIDKGLSIVECTVERMPFEDASFDVAVASHVLEHVPNMGLALQEIRRVLRNGGYLYLFLPKYANMVLAGHINIGWNIGQLMYVLLLNGFDVKNGNFIEYGYSLCAYVSKKDIELPVLRGDRGDIALIDSYDLLPRKIGDYGWPEGVSDGYFGEILSMNWENAEELIREKREEERKGYSVLKKLSILPAQIIVKLLGDAHARGFAHLINQLSVHDINRDSL